MCFSASASFGAGAILSIAGVSAIRKATRPSQYFFATIPLLFAAQQVTEGVIWLSFTNSFFESWNQALTYAFLFFAQVVWPFWVPFSVYKFEEDAKRKKVLRVMVAIGILVSAYLFFCLVNFPVESHLKQHHILYVQHYPEAQINYGGIFYLLVTIVPPFIAIIKRMWLLGAMILISYSVTAWFYPEFVLSVWCYFAAIMSAFIWVILNDQRKLGSEASVSVSRVQK